jgi:hypothetical protein
MQKERVVMKRVPLLATVFVFLIPLAGCGSGDGPPTASPWVPIKHSEVPSAISDSKGTSSAAGKSSEDQATSETKTPIDAGSSAAAAPDTKTPLDVQTPLQGEAAESPLDVPATTPTTLEPSENQSPLDVPAVISNNIGEAEEPPENESPLDVSATTPEPPPETIPHRTNPRQSRK